ncbi:hypothetical protein JXQ31_03070 [candidate division KSB1 bacterium]|nr:hypothetical protein [candidate division KSB1 bacterium]
MSEKKRVCTMLMRVGPTYPGFSDDSEGDDRILTSQFSCIRTASAVGPDNNVANPHECNSSRSCFTTE